ncbi:MAG: luciferase family protein [Solirubrobacterales bacterium]
MSGATESDAGLASGFGNTTIQVGGAIGLAVLATVATERTDGLLADGGSSAAALNSRLSPRVPDRSGPDRDRGRRRRRRAALGGAARGCGGGSEPGRRARRARARLLRGHLDKERPGRRITDEVTSWPGVEAGLGERGEFGFRVGGREIGHLRVVLSRPNRSSYSGSLRPSHA